VSELSWRIFRSDDHLTSAFLCSHAVYPAMKAAGGGKIINIGSMMSIFDASFTQAYAASKGGIVQFTPPAPAHGPANDKAPAEARAFEYRYSEDQYVGSGGAPNL
jgi:hypothetical protein